MSSFSQNGKLKEAKESLKDNNSTNTTTTTTTSKSDSNFSNDNPFIALFGIIALNITYGIAIESTFELNTKMHNAEISAFPYKSKAYGNFVYADSINDYALARLDISNNLVLESNSLYGNNLNINFKFKKRFDVALGYLQLVERINGQTEGFALFSTMVNYHRIRTQKLDLWFGLGAMYVANDVKEFGFAYGLGAEWFMAKPISLLVSYKGTNINSRTVDKTKVLLKYHIKKYHIATGYEHYTLGVSKVSAFSLGFGMSI